MGDGRIKEIQKVRFKVWGVLRSRKADIEVDVLGYRGENSFQRAQGMITTFEEDAFEIRLNIFSNGSKAPNSTSLTLVDQGLDRKSQKGLKGSLGIGKTEITILKEDLFKSLGIRTYGIRIAQMINQVHLLMTTARFLLLIDTNSKEIISCCQYSQNIPARLKNTKILHNIILSVKLRYNIIEVFKILNEKGSDPSSFEFVGILDFSNLLDNLFEIDSLLAFRWLEGETYELNLVAKMMKSKTSAILTKMLFLVQFKLPGGSRGLRQGGSEPTIIYITDICEVEYLDSDLRVYERNDLWNYISFDGAQTAAIQNDYDDETQLQFDDLNGFEMAGYRITNVHINRDLIYIEYNGETEKLIKMIQVTLDEDEDEESENEISEAATEVKKILKLNLSDKVCFDEVSELSRILVLEKNEEIMRTNLKVLDLELDEVKSVFFPWFDVISTFKIINTELVHIVGRESTSSGTPDLLAHGDDLGVPNVSMLLNLDQLTFKRLVVEGEGPLFGAPYVLKGGQVLAFIRDYMPFEQMSSDGIFLSGTDCV